MRNWIIPCVLCIIAADIRGDVHPGNALNFFVNPRLGAYPLDVTFTDMSEMTYDSLLWDFGDGCTSTDSCPVHTYTGSGTYDVTLTGYTGGIVRSITYNDIVEARFLDKCMWNTEIPFARMELDNYVVQDGGICLAGPLDSTTTGTASFVMDVYPFGAQLHLQTVPDSFGTSFISMVINGEEVFICTTDTRADGLPDEFPIPAIEQWDTVSFIGRSDGAGRAGLAVLRYDVFVDCFINGWDMVWPDTVRLEPGEAYGYKPWIFGCGSPCTNSFYLETAPAAMTINMPDGSVAWQPTFADTGTYEVVIRNLPADRTDRLTFVVAKTSGIDDRGLNPDGIPVSVRSVASGGVLELNADWPGTYGLRLEDGAGNGLLSKRTVLQQGLNRISLSPPGGNGIVFLHVSSGIRSAVYKVVLLP